MTAYPSGLVVNKVLESFTSVRYALLPTACVTSLLFPSPPIISCFSSRRTMAPPLPGSDSTRGQRTIIETLSHKAAVEPNRIFGSFAKTADLDDGFHDFTFAELANAVQACAWFIHEVFGSSESFETLIYLGVNDFRYTIVLFAAVMCGYKVRTLSQSWQGWAMSAEVVRSPS